MTVNTTTITGFIVLPDDTVREKSSVIFTMTGFDTDADDNATVVPIPREAPIAVDGSIDIDLWPNPEGVRATFYRVTFSIYNGNKPYLVDGGLIEVPVAGGPYDLNDLLPIAPPEGATVDDYIAQLQASIAATEAAAASAEADADRAEAAAAMFDFVSPIAFGAVADMTYADGGASGPTLTGGTNNLAAFQATDAYAFANDLPVVVPNGQYYLEGEFRPKAKWRAQGDFGVTVWSKISVYEIGVWLLEGGAEWGCEGGGFRMIGQYDRAGTSKPANAGHLGNMVVLGNFLTGSSQTVMDNMGARVLMRRANDSGSQNSDSSFFCNVMGYVKNHNVQIDVWGAGSNVTGNTGLIQNHWGGLIDDGGAWDITMDPSAYEVTESYHPENGVIKFIGGEIDAAAHGLSQIWTRSATINVHMGACSSTGAARPMYDLAGDEANNKAVAAQAGLVGMGNTAGVQSHRNCDPDALSANEAYLSFDRGTSKFDTAPGGVFRQDQYRHSITGNGLTLSAVSGDQLIRRLYGSPDAKFDLGPLYLTAESTDIEKSVYDQISIGGVLDVQSANRAVHLRQSKLDSLFLRTDIGSARTVTPVGDFQLGWESDNAGLIVETTRHTATISAAVTKGDTSISVNSIPSGIPKGTEIFVDGKRLVTSRYASENGTEIEINPSPFDFAISDPVVIILRSEIDELVAEITSSEYGILMRGATINKADLTEMNGQGRHAVWLQTHDNGDGADSIPSFLRIVGGRMPIIGRIGALGGSPTGYTLRIQQRCRAVLEGVDIPASPDVIAHVQAVRTGGSGPWGTVHFDGCRIEDPSTLVDATVIAESVSMTNCVDYTGAPVTIADL